MVLQVNLSLHELGEDGIEIGHRELVGVEAGIGGRSLLDQAEARGAEGASAHKREVW